MGVHAFHPGLGSSVGVRSRLPRRPVLEVGDRNPEALSLDVPLLAAQVSVPLVDQPVLLDDVRDQSVERMGAAWPGGPELFHGSRTKIGEFRHVPPKGGGLRIPGIYTTPEEAISEEYGKPPRSDKPGPPGFRHSVVWALDTPPRVLDVLEPVPDELRAALGGVDIPEGATVLDLLAPDSDTRDAVVAQLPKLYDLLRNSGSGVGLTGTDVDVGTDEWLWLHPDKIRPGGVAEIPARVDPPYVVSQGLSSADRALLGKGQGIRPSSLPATPPTVATQATPVSPGFTATGPLSGSPGFSSSSPELLRLLLSQYVNGGEASLNPESGVGPQFAPSGQRPVDPTAFRAPQGRTADWFNDMPTEQKIGLALMVLSGGMAAGSAAGVGAGGAAVRGGAALLPLLVGQ